MIPRLILLILLSLWPLFAAETDTTAEGKLATAILSALEKGASLAPFMTDSILFSYHEDNRCEGSTDGRIAALFRDRIDSSFAVVVRNDGEGWGCEKKPASEFELTFSLAQKLRYWDRIECQTIDREKGRLFVVGGGASDYLTLTYVARGKELLVTAMEYRSEDPG